MSQATQALMDQTVGQLVVDRPSRARIFEKFGIDYCCGGGKPLREAIEQAGLNANSVLAELQREQNASDSQPAGQRDWATASLSNLCDHIEQTHHAYLRQELPRLEFLTAKVASRHGQRRPELIQIRDIFASLKAEMESHMIKEERILFPMCRQLDNADRLPQFHCGSVSNPISVMIREHDDAGDALSRIRVLSNNYTAPDDACNTYHALFHSLHQLERDMHQHVHKENNILFPRAIQAEKQLTR